MTHAAPAATPANGAKAPRTAKANTFAKVALFMTADGKTMHVTVLVRTVLNSTHNFITRLGFTLFCTCPPAATHSLQAPAPIPTATFTRENGELIRSMVTAPTSSTTATCTVVNGRMIVPVALALVLTATATNTPELGFKTEHMVRGCTRIVVVSCTTAIGSTARRLGAG